MKIEIRTNIREAAIYRDGEFVVVVGCHFNGSGKPTAEERDIMFREMMESAWREAVKAAGADEVDLRYVAKIEDIPPELEAKRDLLDNSDVSEG